VQPAPINPEKTAIPRPQYLFVSSELSNLTVREKLTVARNLRVWYDVAVANGQKRDRRQPHGVQQIGMLFVVVSVEEGVNANQ